MKPSSLIVETAGGPEALEDRPSTPRQVWNRIPDEVRERIVDLALEARNRTDELEPPQNDVVNCRKAFDDGNQNNSIAIQALRQAANLAATSGQASNDKRSAHISSPDNLRIKSTTFTELSLIRARSGPP